MKRDMSEAEWQTRVDLAALYRLIHHYGWSDLFGTHISARIPDQPDCNVSVSARHLIGR